MRSHVLWAILIAVTLGNYTEILLKENLSAGTNIPTGGRAISIRDVNETFVDTHNESSLHSDNSNVSFEASDPEFIVVFHLEKLMPYYFYSVSGTVAVLISSAVLGFDVKFVPAKLSSSMLENIWATTKRILRFVSTIILILLAINSWRKDINAIRFAGISGSGEYGYGTMIAIAISSNTKSAVAAWSAVQLQSPAFIFNVKPKYVHLPVVCFPGTIPILPNGASWIAPLKWLYLIILYPYFLLFQMEIRTLVMVVSCCKFAALWFSLKVCCCCMWWSTLLVVSLGYASACRASFSYWWSLAWPSFWISALQIGTYLMTGFSFFLFGFWLICNGAPVQIPISIFDTDHVLYFRLHPSIEKLLWEIQPQDVKDDFEKAVVDERSETTIDLQSQRAVDENAETTPDLVLAFTAFHLKMRFFASSAMSVSSLLLFELAIIILIRAFTSAGETGFVLAQKKTILERHISTYLSELHSAVHSVAVLAVHQLADHGVDFGSKVDILWNFI